MIRGIWFELVKLSCQKKSYIPFAGYLLFIALCFVAFKNSTSSLAAMLGGFEVDRTQAAKYLDGFFFARILLGPTFIIRMPIVMAALGGGLRGRRNSGGVPQALHEPPPFTDPGHLEQVRRHLRRRIGLQRDFLLLRAGFRIPLFRSGAGAGSPGAGAGFRLHGVGDEQQ